MDAASHLQRATMHRLTTSKQTSGVMTPMVWSCGDGVVDVVVVVACGRGGHMAVWFGVR